MHNYELSLLPTPAQAEELTRLGRLQQGLTLLEELDALTATLPGAPRLNPSFNWANQAVLAHVLDDALVAQMSAAVNQNSDRRAPPAQPALTGSGIVTPLVAGFVAVAGVPGPIAAGTGDPRQLPRWSRAVLGREYAPGQPGTLVGYELALRRAWRRDWADIRQERHGWVLELEFVWDAYVPWALSWTELHDRPKDATLRQLMV